MRVTGLATGMDIDQMVKDTMKPHRIKIQKQQQQKEITEIKQQLYRDVIKESRELYNKYFDVAKTDSLLLSKNWSTVKLQSSNENVLTVTSNSDAKPGNYTVTGEIATAAKAVVTKDLDKVDKLVINGKEFKLEGETVKSRAENLNKQLKEAKINVSVRYSDFAGTTTGTTTENKSGFIFESTVLGKASTFTIGGATPTTIGTPVSGGSATYTTNIFAKDDIGGKIISINGNFIDMSKAVPGQEVEHLNKVLKEQNINITATIGADNKTITLTSNVVGADTKIDVSRLDGATISSQGTDASITIKDGKGGVYTHTGTSNTVTLDGITFKFTGEIPSGSTINVNGKTDVTEVKDKLVNFINDYNKLMEKLNTATSEKRNKNYMPLTDEQKKDMSESEIKLWDEKVKKGQLYKDSDISRIANSMKSAMRGLVAGVDGNLEKFGISPVADYQGVKNGTFTIDETKLTAALENKPEEVMKLFISSPASTEGMSDQEKYGKTGIAQRLKTILYNETVTTSSSLIKKAGIEGSASVGNNELTKSIEKYDRKMKDMEKDFSRREQQLYSKWASIETMMNKLNSQQSYLMSQLGMK